MIGDTMDMHSFSVDVAKEVGVNAAILLQSIKWWCAKNKANGKNEHDGLHWTYNSIKAWQELYPYLGRSAIESALKRLEERGFVKVGNYNKSPYDRTKWYAITREGLELFGESISRFPEMDSEENANPSSGKPEPIPVTEQIHTRYDTDKRAQAPKRFRKPTREEVSRYVREKGYHFDPNHFYDYYDSAGWTLGNGRKVTSWKRCCVTWENRTRGSVSDEARHDLGLDRYTTENASEVIVTDDGTEEIWY